MNKMKTALYTTLTLGLMTLSSAHAALYLKSSGDQWGPAMQDLQMSYNEGVSSNNFNRFYSTLNSRFNLDGSTPQDILDALKGGKDTSSQNNFNNGLNNPPTGGGNGNNGGGNNGNQGGVNQSDLDKKVDKTVYAVDKQAQVDRDKGQDETIKSTQGAAQIANDRASNLEVRADNAEGNIRNVQGAAQTANDRATALEGRTDVIEHVNDRQDVQINDNSKAIHVESQARIAGDNYTNSRIDTANQFIEANRQSINKTNKQVAQNTADIANHEERINGLEQKTNRAFSSMGKRIDKVQDKANAGVSAAFASAGIPQVTDNQRFAMGAGIGGYEGENALAVGFSARITDAVVLKASVASDSQSGVGYNAGLAVGW